MEREEWLEEIKQCRDKIGLKQNTNGEDENFLLRLTLMNNFLLACNFLIFLKASLLAQFILCSTFVKGFSLKLFPRLRQTIWSCTKKIRKNLNRRTSNAQKTASWKLASNIAFDQRTHFYSAPAFLSCLMLVLIINGVCEKWLSKLLVLARQTHTSSRAHHRKDDFYFLYFFHFAFCFRRIIPKAKVFSHINRGRKKTKEQHSSEGGLGWQKKRQAEKIYIPFETRMERRVW